MVLPYVDRSPLRAAMRTQTNAEISGVSFEKLRLQEKQNNINTALGFAQLGLQAGKAVYSIFEAKKLEEAKKVIYEEDQALRDTVQKGIYDGTIGVETIDGENGPETIINMPEDLTERMNQFENGLNEKFKGFSEVRRWAKDASRQNMDNAKSWAYKVAFEKGIADRDASFSSNLETAYKDSVNYKDPQVYESQINSATWLSPDKKAALKTTLDSKFKYDTYEQDVFTTVEAGGLADALKKADAFEGSSEDKTALRKRAMEKYNTIETITTNNFIEEYNKGKEAGRTPKDIIDGLNKKNIPDEYKKAAIDEVLKVQTNDAIKYGNNKYNQVRDNPDALKKEYKDIKSGAGSLMFSGIDVTHKAVLDMFEKRMEEFDVAAEKTPGENKTATNDMYKTFTAYQSDALSETEAVNYIRSLADAGGSSKVAMDIETDIYTKEKPGYKEIFTGFDAYVSASIKDKDYSNMGLAGELKANLRDLMRDGMSYTDLQKRKDMAIGILAGKSADYARGMIEKGGFVEGEFKTVDKQEFNLMKEIEAGELDDMISMDQKTGQYKFAGGSQKIIIQLQDAQEERLNSMGLRVMKSLEKQGNDDVTAWPIFTDMSGRKIKFFTTEDGTTEPRVYIKDRWQKEGTWTPLVDKRAKAQKPVAEPWKSGKDR